MQDGRRVGAPGVGTAMSEHSRVWVAWVLAAVALGGCGGDDDDGVGCALPGDVGPCGVCTTGGALAGSTDGDTCAYLGVPFAEPPVGELRWEAPVAAGPWEGVRQATDHAPACPQGQLLLAGAGDIDEDCLYLNVHTPAEPADAPLPVMVFIHGGGYTAGAARTFSGRGLVERGPAVVVTVQYRLGPLGFFAHPELDATRPDAPAGSDGIRDQQLALRWVQDNIAAFGGDPENVTLFGESAGSSAVNVHLVSPRSAGLVHRFIMESGAAISGVRNGIEPIPVAQMHAVTQAMAADLCPAADDVMACLREVPAETLMGWSGGVDAGVTVDWVPVIEGQGGVLPKHPDVLMASGDFNPGEIIIGTNHNEHALFVLTGDSSSANAAELRAFLEAEFGDDVEELLSLYLPDGDDAGAADAHIALMTDVRFRCVSRRLAVAASGMDRDVYLYSFEHGPAQHGDELVYVFGDDYYTIEIAKTLLGPIDPDLTDAIQRYWLSFATDGDPNTDGLAAWPRYTAAADPHLVLQPSPRAGSGLQSAQCDFWDAYLARH